MKIVVVTLVVVLSLLPAAFAASLAFDAASNSTYNSGWTSGMNGGSGFGAWTLSPQPNAGGGFFVWDSTQNGVVPSGGINTGGKSLGFYGNPGSAADGWRSLQGGALSVGQTFSIDFDNGWVDNGSVGWGLQNSSSQNLIEVWYAAGGGVYTINDSSGAHASTNGYTDGGFRLQLSLTGATSYNLSLIQGTATNTYSGLLISQADQGIQQFHIWNGGAGSGQNFDTYINSMAVVPEPGTMAMMGLALAGMTVFFRHVRRRRKI